MSKLWHDVAVEEAGEISAPLTAEAPGVESAAKKAKVGVICELCGRTPEDPHCA